MKQGITNVRSLWAMSMDELRTFGDALIERMLSLKEGSFSGIVITRKLADVLEVIELRTPPHENGNYIAHLRRNIDRGCYKFRL